MKKIIILVIIVNAFNVFSQKNNVSNTFGFHFIQEKILIIKNTTDDKISYDLNFINIEVDSLNNYDSEIVFYKFKLGSNKVNILNNQIDVSFNSNSCNEYILAFNLRNETSYRLKGFNGNDLLFLLRDINYIYNPRKKYKNLLSSLNNLKIGVDFKAIHKDLLNLDFESENLKVCSEPLAAHGKNE
jgi:hypothetical protein